MKVLAIVASARKGKSTDTLVDKAIAGLQSAEGKKVEISKINLHDYNIKFCRDCLACRDSKKDAPYVDCILDDDMKHLFRQVDESDALIVGTPLHMGTTPGIMTTFLERICWAFAKPEQSYLTVHGCPLPRSEKKRNAVIIITNSIVPPVYRKFCDAATPIIKDVLSGSLNSKTVGDLYAGNLEKKGADYYFNKAFKLGQKLYETTQN